MKNKGLGKMFIKQRKIGLFRTEFYSFVGRNTKQLCGQNAYYRPNGVPGFQVELNLGVPSVPNF